MNIYLVRHAQAEPGYPDAERPLTERGRGHARQMGEWLGRSPSGLPARIFCSPLVRAQETLKLLGTAWDSDPMSRAETMDFLVPGGDPEEVVATLEAMQEDVLLVGHNPHMELLASLLMTGDRTRACLVMKTGVLLRFKRSASVRGAQAGLADLRWMLDPRCLKE